MSAQGGISRTDTAGALCLAILTACVLGISGSPPTVSAQEAPSSELTTHETDPAFKVQVERNLVLVRVIVRDSKGRPVGNLRKEDFRLLDNGKAQAVAHFAVEIPATKVPDRRRPSDVEAEPEVLPETTLAASTPERYLGLFFDDVHMVFEDIARTRAAAQRYLANALQPGDRVGIFTTSGEHTLDFTDDRGLLHEALLRIQPRSIVAKRERICPDIFDYQAYMIVHRRDPFALAAAVDEAYQCQQELRNVSTEFALDAARNTAETEAFIVLNQFQTETEFALRSLDQLVRRMAAAPGQRSIVLISPGFLMVTAEQRVDGIVERALRSNVVINSLDAKGLATFIPFGDASHNPVVIPQRADLAGRKTQLAADRLQVASDVLRTLSYDTGGSFFHNSNDLDDGFRKVGSLPEVYYVLGFSPQNLKFDGRFHTLKVGLNSQERFTIQARAGYYAPQKPPDPTARAQEEIEQAIFSHDELHELPVEVHTQFFKTNELDAKLSVLTHVDLRFVQFRKESGRNVNNLSLVTVLFDRDGRYVTGKEKRLEFRLLDGSLQKLTQSGITAKTSFEVKPGTYLVRQVVRDSEGAQLSALNRTVEIPF